MAEGGGRDHWITEPADCDDKEEGRRAAASPNLMLHTVALSLAPPPREDGGNGYPRRRRRNAEKAVGRVWCLNQAEISRAFQL